MEEWRQIPIPVLEGYLVSSDGRVARVLKTHGLRGYWQIGLKRGARQKGNAKTWMVHRLVAHAFIGPPPGPEYQINHKNFDPGDNRPENLEWVHPTDNGNRNRRLSEDDVKEIVRLRGKGMAPELAARFGVSENLIRHIWYGYAWRRVIPPPTSRRPNPRGSNNGNAVLTEDQAREIRQARGITRGIDLARQYNVSPATIHAIWRGQNWAWLPDMPPPGERLSQKGASNPHARLTEEAVIAIRSSQGAVSIGALAAEYHVSEATISSIWSRKRWGWLP